MRRTSRTASRRRDSAPRGTRAKRSPNSCRPSWTSGPRSSRFRAQRWTDAVIVYQTLKNWQFREIEHRYTADDSMFYALAVGLGADPVDERQLAFVNDTKPGTPLAVPTMAVILGYPGSWMRDPRTGIDFTMIVHGEELVELHKPLPAAATVLSKHRVTRVVDKGAGKGATVTYDKELFDKTTGEKLATVTHTTFCRGDGGFSARDGVTDASPSSAPKVPQREPDLACELRTLPQQAL